MIQGQPTSSTQNCESERAKGKWKRNTVAVGKKSHKFDTESAPDFPDECQETDPQRKDLHNAIEKKRRDKMNTYLQGIRYLIQDPMNKVSCKSDKLSVLKATSQFLCKMRGIPNVSSTMSTPSFLSNTEIQGIISQMDCGFIIITDILEGTIVWEHGLDAHLGYEPGELLGTSIFGHIKQEDIATYKTSSCIKAPGSISLVNKRTFLCNFIRKPLPATTHKINPLNQFQYLPVVLSGEVEEIKTSLLLGDRAATSGLGECIMGFVAIGQGLATNVLDATQGMRDNVRILAREGPDGKIEYIHDAIYYIMGYTPSELYGHTLFEFVHPHDSKRLYMSLFHASNMHTYTEPIIIRLKHKSAVYKVVTMKRLAVRHPTHNVVNAFISCLDETFVQEDSWDSTFPVEEPMLDVTYDPLIMLRQETFVPRMLPQELGMDPSKIPSYPNVLQPQDFSEDLSDLFDQPIYLKDAVEKYEYSQNFVNQPFEGTTNNNVPTPYNSLATNFVDIFTGQPF